MKKTTAVFSTNLRNYLDAQRKTQSDLARHLNVSAVSVSRWANGESLPRANMLDRICAYLGCSTEDLMTDHSKPVMMLPEDILAEEIHNNPRLMRIMFHLMKMSDEELDKIIERIAKK